MRVRPFETENLDGTTSLDDYSELKLSWVQNRTQLDGAEADNIRLAASKFLAKRRYAFPQWFTIPHINQVHKAMFGEVWEWAGKYRRSEKSIGVKANLIPIEMKKLEHDILYWGEETQFDPIETVARVHHRLVWIHPYENGNGRHGRFIGDMVLRSFQLHPAAWPRLIESNKERSAYIEALKHADLGDFSLLIAFIKRYL